MFFESRVKTKKGTMSEGVAEKVTRTGFGLSLWEELGRNQGKHKQPKDKELEGSKVLLNNFSNEEPRERPILGIRLIK